MRPRPLRGTPEPVPVEPPTELRIELPLSEANAIATVENNPMLAYTFDHREAVYG